MFISAFNNPDEFLRNDHLKMVAAGVVFISAITDYKFHREMFFAGLNSFIMLVGYDLIRTRDDLDNYRSKVL